MGTTKGGTRRKHSDDFRAEVLAQCRQSGKSIAGVALKHGLNANMVRIWLRKSEPFPICHLFVDAAASSATLASEPQQFVAVRMDVPPVAEDKCVKRPTAINLNCAVVIRRQSLHGRANWRVIAAPGCASGCDDPHRRAVAGHRSD